MSPSIELPKVSLTKFRLVCADHTITEGANIDAFLPGDADTPPPTSALERMSPTANMASTLLAITTAEPGDSAETIRVASVVGFVYVSEVDEKKKKASKFWRR